MRRKSADINLDDLARLQRVGGPVVSPDGEWVIYTVSQVDTKEDKSSRHLWMVKWDGSVHLQLTYGKEGASSPKFSPDGRYISFMSSRPGTAKGDQVWVMDRRGGEAEQFTAITDQNIQGYSWSPDSKKLLLTLHPKTEPDPEEGKPPAPPKPIVIDRYHFKQDIQGYLRDDAYNALYLWDLTSKKTEKLTTSKNVNEDGRRVVARRQVGRLCEQRGAGSGPLRQLRRLCGGGEGRDRPAKKLTTWTGPDRRTPGLVAAIRSRLHTPRERNSSCCEYSQATPAVVHAGRQGQLSGSNIRSQRGSPLLLGRWRLSATWSPMIATISG